LDQIRFSATWCAPCRELDEVTFHDREVVKQAERDFFMIKVVMFPAKHLDMGVLREILRGGHDKVMEAGACLVGGHTVDDEEPEYGLCGS
jgi:hypothetical protein